MMKSRSLIIQGARQNNLKNLTIEIPHQELVVITGPSGSGKSSLAFDTIFAEGQRLYFESLSTYVRQFLERVPRPDVDKIENISPTIALEQRNTVKTSRMTVASSTEIYDYLRLLYSKIGKVFCSKCQIPIKKDTISEILDFTLRELNHQHIMIIAPFSTKSTPPGPLIKELMKKGLTRVLISDNKEDKWIDLTPEFCASNPKEIWIVLDRLQVSHQVQPQLTDSLEIAYRETKGKVLIKDERGNIHKFSLELSCSHCDQKFPERLPSFFSFNHPYGACPHCKGFGNNLFIDEALVIPNKNLSLEEGTVDPWTKPSHAHWQKRVLEFAKKEKISTTLPYNKLGLENQKKIFDGTKKFKGVTGFFKKLEKKKYKMGVRVFLSRYKSTVVCKSCKGTRLRPETLLVKIGKYSISEIHAMTIEQAKKNFDSIKFTPYEAEVSREILKQIRSRLSFLSKVGVDYLTLNRLMKTLSGGEAQRINLAGQLGAQLMQTIYILDEPSIGLHPKDNNRLLSLLKNLRDQGNTVIVVEHDPEFIRTANYIVELGPEGGQKGGHLVFQGPYKEFLKHPSLTASYLEGRSKIDIPTHRRTTPSPSLTLTGVTHHNLKGINLTLPLNRFICVTGISGSGKSSLIHETLYHALSRIFKMGYKKMGKFKTISGFKYLKAARLLDQKPIGKSSRSNPITYIKAYDDIRKIFSDTLESKKRGYTPSTFSFNTTGGRCNECRGEGLQKIEMHFLADIYLTCEYCNGKKFKNDILEIEFKSKNIFDILSMTVDETFEFFLPYLSFRKKIKILREVGLGYLRIGQSAPTLSGGEAQRLKIARELSHEMTDTLYILDEPTTGLHLDDIKKLLAVLNRLVDQGNTIVVIEHNLEVIKTADYVIDLGPEGGDRGGKIIGEGTPEEIAKIEGSYTGQYLKKLLV